MVSMPDSSFLPNRNEKMPTRIGTTSNIAPTHRNMTAPKVTCSGVEPGFCAITSGICVPNNANAPRHISKTDGKPHATVVAIVKAMATVRFIGSLVSKSLFEYTSEGQSVFLRLPFLLTSQFCSHLMFQPLDDLLADCRRFGICHRFIGLIREAIRQ